MELAQDDALADAAGTKSDDQIVPKSCFSPGRFSADFKSCLLF
jgi:hypothetical protein